jgi:hypothetical protein
MVISARDISEPPLWGADFLTIGSHSWNTLRERLRVTVQKTWPRGSCGLICGAP